MNAVSIPGAARWYGAGGLIPFASLALFIHFGPQVWTAHAQFALLAYGAVILSFLGGILWGMAIKSDREDALLVLLGASVLPSLLGWISLMVIPSIAVMLQIAGFLAMFLTDRKLAGNGLGPSWYMNLRGPLTAGVVACLAIAGLA